MKIEISMSAVADEKKEPTFHAPKAHKPSHTHGDLPVPHHGHSPWRTGRVLVLLGSEGTGYLTVFRIRH